MFQGVVRVVFRESCLTKDLFCPKKLGKEEDPMLTKSLLNRIQVPVSCTLMTLMILLSAVGTGEAAAKPGTVAEIALYQGSDREQILVEGAKKEGQVMFYNNNTWMSTVAQEFEKKYPFVKVSIWRSETPNTIKKVMEEYASGRFIADVIEETHSGAGILHSKGIYQEYYSPETSSYSDEVKVKGKTGVYYLADREIKGSILR